jgi:Dullard-like phosphatase family protein
MDDTLTLMTFEKLKDPSTGATRECDTVVTSHENPSEWGLIYHRPYLGTFLEAVSKVYEVVLFTAACREYAEQILNTIDPDNRLFHHRLFRDSCQECIPNPSMPDAKVYVKDLRVLGRNLNDVILIDNSLLCFAYQPDNGIVCNPYKGSQDDSELISMLEILAAVNQYPKLDVRRLFRRMYGISNMIEEYSNRGGRVGVVKPEQYLLDTPLQTSPVTPFKSSRLPPDRTPRRNETATPRTVMYPHSTPGRSHRRNVRSPSMTPVRSAKRGGRNAIEEDPVPINAIINTLNETPNTSPKVKAARRRERPSLVPSARFVGQLT